MKNLWLKFRSKYRYSAILLKQFVKTDFKLRYQGSVLGYLWSLLRPLAIFSILYIVFVRFLNVGESIPNFAVYLLIGIILWNFFVEITSGSVSLIVGKGDLLRKLNFPRYIVILAGSFSALINLFLNLIVVMIFVLVVKVDIRLEALLALPLMVELYLFALAIAFFLSALYVRFRDIGYIWEVLMQAAFYATPILYPVSLVVEKSNLAAKLLLLNPVAQVIQDIRYVVVTDQTVTLSKLFKTSFSIAIPISIVLLSFFIGGLYFRKRSKYFAEEI